VHLVEVLVEEDGDLEQRSGTEPRDSHAAVALQAEERPQALLAAARRAERNLEMRLCGAGIREGVHRSRRNDEDLARPQAAPVRADAEPQLARNAFEALPLACVHVRRHEPARPDEQLACDTTRCPFAEDDALARHGIRDRVYHEAERSI
jgi:hypothetical protein